MPIRYITTTALLASIIALSGSLKVPGILPGTEFQLSAPIAVAICAVYGFRQYFLAGILASSISLILGTQTVFNIAIALLFRLTVGLVLIVGGNSFIPVVLAGPLGSFIARLSLVFIMQQAAWAVILSAVPGMIYTALAAWPLTIALRKITKKAERGVSRAL